jgi:hypothetical protein
MKRTPSAQAVATRNAGPLFATGAPYRPAVPGVHAPRPITSTSSVVSPRCTNTCRSPLEEQRRDQREQLQEERRGQHLAEDAAAPEDRVHEPADVEVPRQVAERSAIRAVTAA